MVRGDDGVWSVTTPPAVPGLHAYRLIIDGAAVSDPASESYGPDHTSAIEVPEKGVTFYDPQDVPHGAVEEVWFHSKVTGEFRRLFVYTPPGYDRDPKKKYPVLYVHHGASDDETGWVREGRLNFIMDNLIAAGKTVPMIVVMGRGTATRAGEAPGQAADPSKPSAIEDVVMKDVIPVIDGRYRTKTDRDNRAIAGLSQGASQAVQIGTDNLDSFAWIGDFSGGFAAKAFKPETSNHGVFMKADMLNSRLRLFWLGSGTAEMYYQYLKPFDETLTRLGVKHVFWESQGTSHEWLTWRRDLHEFAPLLFHPK
jgi:enterochelin esterase-like enzyme